MVFLNFNFVRGAFVTGNICSIPVYASVYIPPDEYYWAGIAALTIPLFLMLNLASLLLFAAKKSGWALLPGLILAAFSSVYFPLFSANHKNDEVRVYLRAVSYNTGSFKYFSKKVNRSFDDNKRAFEKWVISKQLDIICVQEMIGVGMAPYLIEGYQHASSVKITASGDHLGLYIFSKYQILDQGEIAFAGNSYNRLMWVDILAHGDTIRVTNVHLMSYDFGNGTISQKVKAVRTGVMARSWHAKLIDQFIQGSPYPVILMGDLNETPYSYVYQSITRKLADTFVTSGSGFDYTYSYFRVPFRIDYIFIDKSFSSRGFEIIHDLHQWSDHSPVLVQIGLPDLDE